MKIIDSSAFMECRSLTTVKGGANVEKIYKEAFCWCPQLKNIIIPDTVKEIGTYAFLGCRSLTTLTGGKNLEWLGSKVFGGCEQLKSII